MASHPMLEPHFNVAAALAQPGVGWLALCERGVQHRHLASGQDLVDYLGAWCSAAHHDPSDALFRLGKLKRSAVYGLAAAIKRDVVDLVIDRGSSKDVEGLLRRSDLIDVETVDLLAASYFDVGRNDDAAAMNELATAMVYLPKDDVRCRRLVRAVILAPTLERADAARKLHEAATSQVVADPTCTKLDDEVRCWLDSTVCDAYVRGIDPKKAALYRAVRSWPESGAEAGAWMEVAQNGRAAIPVEGAALVTIVALELVLETSMCLPDGIESVHTFATFLRDKMAWPEALEDRLEKLITATVKLAAMPELDCEAWIVSHSR